MLLDGGRTAHSRFKIPIELNNESTCNIKCGSPEAQLIIRSSLIIWDEAPMTNRYAFEALDRTLRDIMKEVDPEFKNIPFGNKIILFGGDFRQILPVIKNGTKNQIINASIKSSTLWQHMIKFHLKINMRIFKNPEQGKNFCSLNS